MENKFIVGSRVSVPIKQNEKKRLEPGTVKEVYGHSFNRHGIRWAYLIELDMFNECKFPKILVSVREQYVVGGK